MPWNEVFLPPLAGAVRAVSLECEDFAVWNEHGLFRYKVGSYPFVQVMYPGEAAASKVNPATGQVGWTSFRYRLVGDSRFVPAPAAGLIDAGGPDGQRLRHDRRARRLEVLAGRDVRLRVESFPERGSGWFVATFLPQGNCLLLADPAGVRIFSYTEVPAEKMTRWDGTGVRDQHASLLAAILAEPDDDGLRLIYADFLEENGDPARAEFIRLQCGLAQRMRQTPVPDQDPDSRRLAELEEAHGEKWFAELPQVRGIRLGGLGPGEKFWRGFATLQADSAPRLLQAQKDLGDRTPLEYIQINSLTTSGARTLIRSGMLARLRVFHVYDFYRSEVGLELLLSSADVSGLRGLVLHGANERTIETLVSSPHLGNLEWVSLWGNLLSDQAAAVLAEAKNLPRVRWLVLYSGALKAGTKANLQGRFRLVER